MQAFSVALFRQDRICCENDDHTGSRLYLPKTKFKMFSMIFITLQTDHMEAAEKRSLNYSLKAFVIGINRGQSPVNVGRKIEPCSRRKVDKTEHIFITHKKKEQVISGQ